MSVVQMWRLQVVTDSELISHISHMVFTEHKSLLGFSYNVGHSAFLGMRRPHLELFSVLAESLSLSFVSHTCKDSQL